MGEGCTDRQDSERVLLTSIDYLKVIFPRDQTSYNHLQLEVNDGIMSLLDPHQHVQHVTVNIQRHIPSL